MYCIAGFIVTFLYVYLTSHSCLLSSLPTIPAPSLPVLVCPWVSFKHQFQREEEIHNFCLSDSDLLRIASWSSLPSCKQFCPYLFPVCKSRNLQYDTLPCPPACASNSSVKRTNSIVCYNRPLSLTVSQVSLCESCPVQYQTDFSVPNTLQCLPPGLLDVTIPAGSSCFVYTLCQQALLAPILQSPSIPIYLCLLLWATMCSIEVLNLFFQVWP